MDAFIIYLIGWLVFSVCVYIYNVYGENWNKSKKLLMWRSFWAGVVSWLGVLFIIAAAILFVIIAINAWVEKKLK